MRSFLPSTPPDSTRFNSVSDLADLELRLRQLLPASLYAAVWVDSGTANLMRVFEHLRTLQHILHDYTPRQLLEVPPQPGLIRYSWQQGTLLFTDLAGFTPLLEANAKDGQRGAAMLLDVLNHYFSNMIEIVSKSGGDLLEFTGDAILVQFLSDHHQNDAAQATRAGLRMQRAMANFYQIEAAQGEFSLGMRVGIHSGAFLTADIGTPMRMAHVLLGQTVQQAKQAEGAGTVGRVCLTQTTCDRLQRQFRMQPAHESHWLVNDDLTAEQLGEYDISLSRRRLASALLFDRSPAGLIAEIQDTVKRIEPLTSYLPAPILSMLVESAAKRQISPQFLESVVMFVNLSGLPESVDAAEPHEVDAVVASFSKVFAQINAAAGSRGGILQKVTYHRVGSDILIYFGVLTAHSDDALRAAETALAVQTIVAEFTPPCVGETPIEVNCRIGLASGFVFAAEIGEPRGRREFNVLGDPVNTASRLMSRAARHQTLVTEPIYNAIAPYIRCESLGQLSLKGKALPTRIFAVTGYASGDRGPIAP